MMKECFTFFKQIFDYKILYRNLLWMLYFNYCYRILEQMTICVTLDLNTRYYDITECINRLKYGEPL